eukprot:1110029-Ditylum_brightwellii.AAC.1
MNELHSRNESYAEEVDELKEAYTQKQIILTASEEKNRELEDRIDELDAIKSSLQVDLKKT